MNDKPIYEVIKDNESPELSTIRKSNITAEITLAGTLKSIEHNRKAIESLTAELDVKKALMSNVESFHPEVKKVDEKLKIACHTHYEASRFVHMAEQKLREFDAAQAELQSEVEAIYAQTGIKKDDKKEAIEKVVKEAISAKSRKGKK